jgi:hypothetical protein
MRQFFARCNANLLLHDVYARNQLGHGVLYLHAGVHLNKVELAVFVEKFKSARTTIADFFAGIGAARAYAFNQFAGDARRWRFFNDFLVAALHRAVALAQIHGVFVRVGQDLNFDMAWVLQELFHIHRWVAKSRARFGLGHLHGVNQRRFGVHHAHTAATAAACGFDDDGVAHALGRAFEFGRVVAQLALRARHAGHARFDHGLLGRDLVAHDANRRSRRADEYKARLLHAFGKIGVFAQKAITWVDGLRVADLGRRNDGWHIQIALRRRRRAYANGLVRQLHIFGIAVGFGIDHHGLNTHLAASALHAQSDLPAIGN